MSIEAQIIWEHDMSVLHQERLLVGKRMTVGIMKPTFQLRLMEVAGEDRIKLIHLNQNGEEITEELQGDDITQAQLFFPPPSGSSDHLGRIVYVPQTPAKS